MLLADAAGEGMGGRHVASEQAPWRMVINKLINVFAIRRNEKVNE